ncbi:hypothetical protein DF281_00955 [Kurthia zopfii]|nr:hypothetical protein DF281_00955 [Kurthia zopfii]
MDNFCCKLIHREDLFSRISCGDLILPRKGLPFLLKFFIYTKYFILSVYYDSKEVYKKGELIPLFVKEKNLLFYLLENKGRILSLDQIIDRVWGVDGVEDTKVVSVNISTLRRKLEDNPSKPVYIHTKRGYGYQFSM